MSNALAALEISQALVYKKLLIRNSAVRSPTNLGNSTPVPEKDNLKTTYFINETIFIYFLIIKRIFHVSKLAKKLLRISGT